MSRLKELAGWGQSVWLDNLTRGFIADGGLQAMIENDGLQGVTSNPSIFEKAIAEGDQYQAALNRYLEDGDQSVAQIYEHLALADIRRAADVLRPVYDRTQGRDGYISLECSPYLADDTGATMQEALRLWQAVDRPNLMVKVPATPAGIPAIRDLTAAGLNINITLLFSVPVYEQVADAYLSGLEARLAAGEDISNIQSVASFFISRIDSAVDARLAELADRDAAARLTGKIGIANAKIAYARYQALVSSRRFRRLADAGAHSQRLLWASTGVKNPDFRDTLYIDALIGRDTVSTIPPATMQAFNAHGKITPDAVEQDVDGAEILLRDLGRAGISLPDITAELVRDGVRKFADSFDKLFAALAKARRHKLEGDARQQLHGGSEALEKAIASELDNWRQTGRLRRLWDKDSSLWSGADEARWLGWLRVPQEELAGSSQLAALADDVRQAGFRDVVLLGMGGSSLGAEVLASSLPRPGDAPRFHILDSTDPMQIGTLEQAIDLANTLFIVSSKSGSTLEVRIFCEHFFNLVRKAVGEDAAGRQFIAVTDPGSALERQARALRFRQVFYGVPDIGGRYSVLSNFGLVLAAAIGIDTHDLLRRTLPMLKSCAADVPPAENPAVQLGIAMAIAATQGRDKLTVIASPAIAGIGAWLEQLLAESLGKAGRGIIPVADEPLVEAGRYGDDRFFVYLELRGEADAQQRQLVDELQAQGHPLVRIRVAGRRDLGQEFFRWEMATAVAGAVFAINPFDQPDVEASKVKTRELTTAYAQTRQLPKATPLCSEQGMALYTDAANAAALGAPATLMEALRAHFGRLQTGDYVAILAYVERNAGHMALLNRMREAILRHSGTATCLGFGPRFQHSSGQLYKGGPDTGLFLQITSDSAADIDVPDQPYSFHIVEMAQAQGELAVLAERGRRVLRVHLQDVETGLPALLQAIEAALGN